MWPQEGREAALEAGALGYGGAALDRAQRPSKRRKNGRWLSWRGEAKRGQRVETGKLANVRREGSRCSALSAGGFVRGTRRGPRLTRSFLKMAKWPRLGSAPLPRFARQLYGRE